MLLMLPGCLTMLIKPDLKDEEIARCLRNAYKINVNIFSSPLGADLNTAVYRVTTSSSTDYFFKKYVYFKCPNKRPGKSTIQGSRLTFKFWPPYYIMDCDLFHSSSIQARLDDLHDAFHDKNVKAIFTARFSFRRNTYDNTGTS
jgi:hypothetical protein